MHISIVSVALTVTILGSSTATAEACCEDEARIAIEDGNTELAFTLLSPCEHDRNATGEALHNLAVLYLMHGDGTEKHLAKKYYDLLLKASFKGEETALIDLSSFYNTGEPLLAIKGSKEKSKCIARIADRIVGSRTSFIEKRVKRCLDNLE